MVAAVQPYPVAQRDRLAGRQRVVAILLAAREVVQPEWIGGEQTVSADVPVRGKPEAVRVIQDGNAHGLAVHGAVVIDPGGRFTPSVFVLVAFAADDAPSRLLSARITPDVSHDLTANELMIQTLLAT